MNEQQPPRSLEQSTETFVSGGGEPSPATLEGETAASDLYSGNRLLSLLFNTEGPVWRYILRAGLISLVPSVLVAFLLGAIGLADEGAMPQFDPESNAVLLFVLLVIISPVLETLILGLGLWLLSFATRNLLRQALVSCILWAVLHSLAAPLWGLTIVWPFFVFSCAYLAWRQKSRWHAMGVACGIHMFQNLLPGTLVAFV
jgi:hypothetical protein